MDHVCHQTADLKRMSRAIEVNTASITTNLTELIKLQAVTETHTTELQELKKLYDIMHSMSTNLVVMTQEVAGIKTVLKKVQCDVETLKDIPHEEYKYYKRLVFGFIITTILGIILGKFLL